MKVPEIIKDFALEEFLPGFYKIIPEGNIN